MTTGCVRCTRPMPDTAYACAICADRARAQLAEIADMTPAARDVAHRASNRGGGGSGGKPGSTDLIDYGAMARLDAVQNEFTTIARDIAETRGVPQP